jgi:prefoldin subunit 5
MVSAAILAMGGSLVSIRDTVYQHDSYIEHIRATCERIDARTADYNVTQHKVENLEEQVKKCYADIDRLERR